MKIKILKGCSGLDFSYGQGEVVDAPAAVAKDLIQGGLAEEVKATAPKPKAGGKTNADA